MKKANFVIIGFLIFFLSLFLINHLYSIGSSGEKPNDIIETVNVTNFEVPVRVFLKGVLVDNLTKKDFLLYEGGKKQKINGFYILKKKIAVSDDFSSDSKKGVGKGRYFVLVFRISEFNNQLKKGLNYVFDKVLKKTDQLLIFINDKTLSVNNLENPLSTKEVVSKMLHKESVKAKYRLTKILNVINNELSVTEFNIFTASSMNQPGVEIIKFLEKYLKIWNSYKKLYLTPSVDDYYNFARYLQKINKEKWVINFYQIEMFPKLKRYGEMMSRIRNRIGELQGSSRGEDVYYSRKISNLLMKLNISMNATTDFPADEISKLFYKVNTVFHSIFINTTKAILSKDVEFKKISSNLENSLREITKKTGGTLISSGNIAKSVEKLTNKEDILYMLTYSPEGKKIGKIKIETRNPKYKVVYDNNMRDKYIKRYFKKKESLIPSVKIESVKLNGNKLSLNILDYFFRMENGKRLGKLKIHIKIENRSGEVFFDQRKTIVADKENFKITLSLNNLVKGGYNILVEVLDLLTEKSDMKYLKEEYK